MIKASRNNYASSVTVTEKEEEEEDWERERDGDMLYNDF